MNSLWNLGEWSGQRGSTLGLYQIACPFCLEEGNFELEHRAVKKKPNSQKKINFDTYKCGNCAGYVMVMWSAAEHGRGDLHDFRVLPWVTGKTKAPEYWPTEVQRYWLQAHESVKNEAWDAAAVMIRSALQITLRLNKAKGRTLQDEINDLAGKSILPPIMKEWSDELRFIGNDSAHPKAKQSAQDPKDVIDVLAFLDHLLQYLYDLPHQITAFKKRKGKKKSS